MQMKKAHMRMARRRSAVSVSFLTLLLCLCCCATGCSSRGSVFGYTPPDYTSANKEAAEKFANHLVYEKTGLVPERLSSYALYTDGDNQLVVVSFYCSNFGTADGAICVHCTYGVALRATQILDPDYPFRSHLPELKANFGI